MTAHRPGDTVAASGVPPEELGAGMHAVVRHYKGASELIEELGRRSGDVEKLISGIDGFVAYHLVRTTDGGYSFSVFEDRTGAEESNRQAAEYLKTNLPTVATSPPEIIEGESIIDFRR